MATKATKIHPDVINDLLWLINEGKAFFDKDMEIADVTIGTDGTVLNIYGSFIDRAMPSDNDRYSPLILGEL
jgi:hypothetical protein